MVDVDLTPLVVPCDYKLVPESLFGSYNLFGTIYLIIDCDSLTTYSFWHKSDWIENYELMKELDIEVYTTSIEVPIGHCFTKKYEEIISYVSNSVHD